MNNEEDWRAIVMSDLEQRYVIKFCGAYEHYYTFDTQKQEFLGWSQTAKALNEKDKRIAELERERENAREQRDELQRKEITQIPNLLGDGFSGDSGFESVDEEKGGE